MFALCQNFICTSSIFYLRENLEIIVIVVNIQMYFVLILQYDACKQNYKVAHALHGFLKKFNFMHIINILILL